MRKLAAAASAIAAMALGLVTSPAAANDWFPSKWGAEDRIGAANYMSPEIVIEAAGLIRQGKSVQLGVITDAATPAYPPRTYSMTILQPGIVAGQGLGPTDTTANDDLMTTWLGIGSQIDGLGHVGIGHRYYNGVEAADFVDTKGLTEFGTENIPPIVTRGVVLDITALEGVDRLDAGYAINEVEIKAAAQRQGVDLREGDVVLLHTGHQPLATEDPAKFMAGEPGLGMGGARYLTDAVGVVAVGADTWGLEVIPFEEGTGVFEVHQHLLSKTGTHILENMNTQLLIDEGVSEFLFVLGVPRFRGAVQMVINPIAIF